MVGSPGLGPAAARPALSPAHRLALLSLVLAVLAFLAGWSFGQGAQLIQRVQPTTQAEASLFGDDSGVPGTPIGQPQRLIIRDPAAFLEGEGEGGVRYVSETYLSEKGIYPLQLKTVDVVRNVATLGFLILAALLWWWGHRVRRRMPVIRS